MKPQYERDTDTFNSDAYVVEDYKGRKSGIAWQVLGWEVVDNEDTEWTGIQERTGKIVACMIGDDRYYLFDPEDVKPVDNYCGGCGQIHCKHDERGMRQ